MFNPKSGSEFVAGLPDSNHDGQSDMGEANCAGNRWKTKKIPFLFRFLIYLKWQKPFPIFKF